MTSADLFERLSFHHFPITHRATTRWSDNDMYGHLNNAVYYELFDAAINSWIARHSQILFTNATTIGVVAESGCRFHASAAFPGDVTVGVAVRRLGRSSVTYRLALFPAKKPAPDDLPSATGHWVHVYVDRATGETVEVPATVREVIAASITAPPPAIA